MFTAKSKFTPARTSRIKAVVAYSKNLMQTCMDQIDVRASSGFVTCSLILPIAESLPVEKVLESTCYDLRLLGYKVQESCTTTTLNLQISW